jgi:hypothetical protein
MNRFRTFEEFHLNESNQEIYAEAEKAVKEATAANAEEVMETLKTLKKGLKDAAEDEKWLAIIEKFLSGPGKNLKAE